MSECPILWKSRKEKVVDEIIVSFQTHSDIVLYGAYKFVLKYV